MADRGLRAIALFEGAKGLLGLVLGLALWTQRHRDLEESLRSLAERSGLDPAGGPSKAILAVGAAVGGRVDLICAVALAYAAMRAVECYGLWRERRWAAWFGAISAAVYIPIELVDLVRGPSAFNVGALVVNVLVVAYLTLSLRR